MLLKKANRVPFNVALPYDTALVVKIYMYSCTLLGKIYNFRCVYNILPQALKYKIR